MNCLTPRELELARLVAGGYSNKEISTSLRIAPQTVKNHLHAVYTKLGITNRVELTLSLPRVRLRTSAIDLSSTRHKKKRR